MLELSRGTLYPVLPLPSTLLSSKFSRIEKIRPTRRLQLRQTQSLIRLSLHRDL